MTDNHLKFAGFYIHRISHHLKCMLDKSLKEYDITGQQARVVAHIGRCGKETPLTQKEIGTEFKLKGSSVNSLLTGLEKRGFLYREPGCEDGRIKTLHLTAKGERFSELFEAKIIENENKIKAHLEDREWVRLRKQLRLIFDTLEYESRKGCR